MRNTLFFSPGLKDIITLSNIRRGKKMAKADYTQLAKEVVAAVGGKENIVNVTNCMTRLRFVLKDDSIPDKDKVAGIKGVKGVMNQGGQYQVIIGTHVSEVVKDVRREAQISGEGSINKEDMKLIKKVLILLKQGRYEYCVFLAVQRSVWNLWNEPTAWRNTSGRILAAGCSAWTSCGIYSDSDEQSFFTGI